MSEEEKVQEINPFSVKFWFTDGREKTIEVVGIRGSMSGENITISRIDEDGEFENIVINMRCINALSVKGADGSHLFNYSKVSGTIGSSDVYLKLK